MTRRPAPSMLTILIPTKNRSAFLTRLLRYYAKCGCPFPIRIADSSDSDHYARANEVLAAVSGRLDVERRYYPGISNLACLSDLSKRVSTPYVVYVSDDDLLVPRALEHAVAFLETHADYCAAHGDGQLFTIESDKAEGLVTGTSSYAQRSAEQELASVRLVDYLSTYRPIVFSVQRADALKTSYQYVVDLKLDNSFGELLPSSLPVIRGKVKKLRTLYMARQTHGDMTSRKLNLDLFDWISTPDWTSQWVGFRDCLATELAQQDRLSVEQAREVVKQAFWAHLARGLTGKWDAR